MKSLRHKADSRIRFFGVGEYGEKLGRPHYHVALFGLGMEHHAVLDLAWGRGFVHVGDLNPHSAAYICGYVTKKMTAKDDPRLAGRHPEFARMSLRPGIGAKAAEAIAEGLTQKNLSYSLSVAGDVPNTFKHEGKNLPLGRYLVKRLREDVGWLPDEPREKKMARSIAESLLTDKELYVRKVKRENANRSAIRRVKLKQTARSF